MADEHGHAQGVAKIVTNAGSGAYTITQLWWNPDADPAAKYDDAVAPAGVVAKAARDYLNRASGVPATATDGRAVPFWTQRRKGGRTEFLIDIGRDGGGAFPVMVTKDGGVVGSDSTECTWTYTVKELDDTTILRKNTAGGAATAITPQTPRLHYCAYWYAGETRTAPAAATSRYGLACRAANGDLTLLVCYGEIATDDVCPI